jgi:hypothetical protein
MDLQKGVILVKEVLAASMVLVMDLMVEVVDMVAEVLKTREKGCRS